MGGMSNQISNVLGVAIPPDLRTQMRIRSIKNVSNSADNPNRTNEDLIYMANKTAWVRLVSSVDVRGEELSYYRRYFPTVDLTKPDSLAKNFVLFAGTSTYNENKSGFEYTLKSGFGEGGSYGTLGMIEIQSYGYSPMPGIIDVRVETQGKLGSIRAATINFKVWNKMQLDVVESLYFKVGYLMFLEWGHSVYYDNSGVLQTPKYNKIDPFKQGIKKEDILRGIATNIQKTNGNYDGMLGMCTQFNFTMNQEGGFDCSVKLMALGSLADGIKANQPQALPPTIKENIATIVNTENERLKAEARTAALKEAQDRQAEKDAQNTNKQSTPPQKKTVKEWAESLLPAYKNGGYESRLIPEYGTGKSTFVQHLSGNTSIVPIRLGVPLFQSYEYNADRYAGIKTSGAVAKVFWQEMIKNVKNNTISKINKSDLENLWKSGGIAYYDNAKTVFSTDLRIAGRAVIKDSTGNSYPMTLFIDVPDEDEINPNIIQKYSAYDDPNAQYIYDILDKKFMAGTSYTNLGFQGVNGVLFYINQNLDIFKVPPYPISTGGQLATIYLDVNIGYESDEQVTKEQTINTSTSTYTQEVFTGYKRKVIPLRLEFWDTSIIEEVTVKDAGKESTFKEYEDKLITQNQTTEASPPKTPEQIADEAAAAVPLIDVNAVQNEESLKYQSGLDVFLRATQLRSYIKAKDRAASGQIVKLDLREGGFMKNMLDNGVFQNFSGDLTSDNYDNYIQKNKKILDTDTGRTLFEKFALYGFNHNIMSRPIGADLSDFPTVKFKDLFESYVVPYKVSHGIVSGVSANYPVYIKLGLLMMMLNHMCGLYDSPESAKNPDGTLKPISAVDQTPMMYLDFNPETNFCLSEPLQMSSDTFKFLIPFRGTKSEFKELFTYIKPDYNPETENFLSSYLPEFKGTNPGEGDAYRGKIMNVLVNLDYLLNLSKSFAGSDESQDVNLKPFLQQIIDDMNKYFGNINLLRLAYDDRSNCMYICDDQVQPLQKGESQHYVTNLLGKDANTSDIPLYGKYSIARSFELKTDISSKLSNMLAISANSDIKSDSSKDGTPFGQYNENYIDRYKPQATGIGASKQKKRASSNASGSIIDSERMFESFVRNQFKGAEPITEESIPHATNYYIEKMNKLKGERDGTKSSALLPISVNFTMDGIAGFSMGHAFTLPKQLLPYSYTREKEFSKLGVLGFVVTGLSNNLQGNSWTTDIKANMMFLKNSTAFNSPDSEYNIKELQDGNFVVFKQDTDINTSSPSGAAGGTTGADFQVNPTYKSLITSAKNSVGTSTAAIPGTEGGNIGCGAGTSIIFLRATGKPIVPSAGQLCLGTSAISAALAKDTSNWKKRDDWKNAKPGDIIVTERGSKAGHIGVVVDTLKSDGSYTVISNSSSGFAGSNPGTIQPNYSVLKWQSVANRNPSRTYAYEYIGSFS